MTPSSFTFGIINLFDKYGIKCIKHDVLSPAKRNNSITVPKRSGVYRQPGKYYDERIIIVTCSLPQSLTAADIREIAYDLSDRKPLYFWDEPDLHYEAELFDPHEVELWPGYGGMDVELTFTAYPFALSERKVVPITQGVNQMADVYQGTYESPCLIIIDNTSAASVRTVRVTAVKRSVT